MGTTKIMEAEPKGFLLGYKEAPKVCGCTVDVDIVARAVPTNPERTKHPWPFYIKTHINYCSYHKGVTDG